MTPTELLERARFLRAQLLGAQRAVTRRRAEVDRLRSELDAADRACIAAGCALTCIICGTLHTREVDTCSPECAEAALQHRRKVKLGKVAPGTPYPSSPDDRWCDPCGRYHLPPAHLPEGWERHRDGTAPND